MSGQTQPTSPDMRELLDVTMGSSATASATSLGKEYHCGALQPNCCA